MQATPQSDAISPVTVGDLANFLGTQDTDPLLPGMLAAATDAAIRHLGVDLIVRDWVGIVPAPDAVGQRISPYNAPLPRFELPYTALVDVDSVAFGDSLVEAGYTLEACTHNYRYIFLHPGSTPHPPLPPPVSEVPATLHPPLHLSGT